jgi:predicted phage tail protein
VSATATDSDGTVALVEFLMNGILQGEDTTAPYTFEFNNLSAQNYTITARAIDNMGASSSYSIVVSVTNVITNFVVATQSGNCLISPGTNTITCKVSYPNGRKLYSLLWRPICRQTGYW